MNKGESVLLILLGWWLGVLSLVFVDYVRRWRDRQDLRVSLRSELQQLRFRLAVAAHSVRMHQGTVDREFLKWLKPVLEGYDGPDSSKSLVKVVGDQLNLTDQEIANLATSLAAKPEQSLVQKKFSAPLLDTTTNAPSTLSPRFQGALLAIRTHLGFLNEDIDEARFFLRRTYDTPLDQKNYSTICSNLDNSIEHFGSRAHKIVDLIGKIEASYL